MVDQTGSETISKPLQMQQYQLLPRLLLFDERLRFAELRLLLLLLDERCTEDELLRLLELLLTVEEFRLVRLLRLFTLLLRLLVLTVPDVAASTPARSALPRVDVPDVRVLLFRTAGASTVEACGGAIRVCVEEVVAALRVVRTAEVRSADGVA